VHRTHAPYARIPALSIRETVDRQRQPPGLTPGRASRRSPRGSVDCRSPGVGLGAILGARRPSTAGRRRTTRLKTEPVERASTTQHTTPDARSRPTDVHPRLVEPKTTFGNRTAAPLQAGAAATTVLGDGSAAGASQRPSRLRGDPRAQAAKTQRTRMGTTPRTRSTRL